MGRLSKVVEDMFYAAVTGSVEMLQKAMEAGADINQADDDGSTPLMLAAVNGKKDAVRFLMENGADTKKKDVDGWDAAKLARNAGHEDIAGMLDSGSEAVAAKGTAMPGELGDIAIVAFVNDKAQEVMRKLEEVRMGKGSDERTISEANNLNIIIFAEANSLSKHVDSEVRRTINGILEYLNDGVSKTSSEIGRGTDTVDVISLKDYNVSRLLDADEGMLREVTQEVYDSIVSFVSEELDMRPSEFALKYGAYHKRLMKMREALLDSLRGVGQEGQKKGGPRMTKANIIGKAAGGQ